MADSLFDIFGDLARRELTNVRGQPIPSSENMGKSISSGPFKPNEPAQTIKKDTVKRSFLLNNGKTLQNTPIHQPFAPLKVGTVIYNDEMETKGAVPTFEEIEFSKPSYRYDNYQTDMFDYLHLPNLKMPAMLTPPKTPPPTTSMPTIEMNSSYDDDFYSDEYSIGSLPEIHDNLPELF